MQWPINLDSPIGGEDGSRTFGETIEDPDSVNMDDKLDQEKIISLIRSALDRLTPQEERVLRLRFGISESTNNVKNFPSLQFKGVK